MKTSFIYCLKDPATGDVRYIGKTNNPEYRLSQHLNTSVKKRTHLGNWLRSLAGKNPILAVLHEVRDTESWEVEEQRYISCARAMGMDLVNATDGGDGVTMTPEVRKKIGARLRKPKSLEHRAALSASLKGISTGPKSLEHCAAISAARKGMIFTPEHCAAMSAVRKGKPPSTAAQLANTARRGKVRPR